MRYYANPCGGAVHEAMRAGHMGLIDTPLQGHTRLTRELREAGVPWCADNGAFTARWDEATWWAWLTRHAPHAGTCSFATAPDVVGDAAATAARSAPWLGQIRGLGYPVAYVAQDGLEHLTVPWAAFDVLFLGGTTEWKLGAAARALTAEAVGRGVPVHMGRVNSLRRFSYARAIGCSSVDGTFLTFGPRRNLPQLLDWMRTLEQGQLAI